jgi:hypothetical protein
VRVLTKKALLQQYVYACVLLTHFVDVHEDKKLDGRFRFW